MELHLSSLLQNWLASHCICSMTIFSQCSLIPFVFHFKFLFLALTTWPVLATTSQLPPLLSPRTFRHGCQTANNKMLFFFLKGGKNKSRTNGNNENKRIWNAFGVGLVMNSKRSKWAPFILFLHLSWNKYTLSRCWLVLWIGLTGAIWMLLLQLTPEWPENRAVPITVSGMSENMQVRVVVRDARNWWVCSEEREWKGKPTPCTYLYVWLVVVCISHFYICLHYACMYLPLIPYAFSLAVSQYYANATSSLQPSPAQAESCSTLQLLTVLIQIRYSQTFPDNVW